MSFTDDYEYEPEEIILHPCSLLMLSLGGFERRRSIWEGE